MGEISDTYNRPIANMTLTLNFFREDKFRCMTSYTGMRTMTVSTPMLTKALANVTSMKLTHCPASRVSHWSHAK